LSTFLRNAGHRGIFITEQIHDIICILFADDVACCADTAAELQSQLNSINEFCNTTGMQINKKKTEITVFRNGGPLRSYEKWTYNGEPVNVTSIYKYMGLLFTPKLSWTKAHNKLSAQAKKSINAIKGFQKEFGYFNIKEQFKLFDSMVKPILTYGAELWGTTYSEEIEKVQIQFCKDFLGLGPHVNNSMALGECGRLPLCIDYYIKCLKYWIKLLQMPAFRYPKNCYLMLKSHDDAGRVNWATSVKNLLFKHGFGYVWIAQDVGNIELFVTLFKQRIEDCMYQNWLGQLSESPRCDTYRLFKSLLNPEKYLNVDLPLKHRISFARFRCSNHKLSIEVGRHRNIARGERICTYCFENTRREIVEDEYHVFFQCLKFNRQRNQYLYSWYSGRSNVQNFIELMKADDIQQIKKVSEYIYMIMKEI
jgi:hypothetical protein